MVGIVDAMPALLPLLGPREVSQRASWLQEVRQRLSPCTVPKIDTCMQQMFDGLC